MKWTENLISIDEALGIILENLNPSSSTEVMSITDAPGRILAEDIIARYNVPPFDRAAMDGYTLNSLDTVLASRQNPLNFFIIEEIYAGDISSHRIQPGSCSYIATGAPIPAGADAVVRVEDIVKNQKHIQISSPVTRFENLAPAGEDMQSGTVVLKSGCLLNPARIGVLASQGFAQVRVFSRPVITVITTGEELAQPSDALKPGQIYDVNNATLCSLITLNGGHPEKLAGLGDYMKTLEKGFEKALTGDMVVVSGGSSVGQKDYMHELLASMGKVLFHGLNVKPGKPTLFALVNGKPVLALPGYPTSCLINAYLLLKPSVRKLARLPVAGNEIVEAVLSGRIGANRRRQFVTVKLDGSVAKPTGKESGAITATAHASGYITIAENTEMPDGSTVSVTLF